MAALKAPEAETLMEARDLQVGDIVTIEDGPRTPYVIDPVTRKVKEPRELQMFRITSLGVGGIALELQ